MKRKILKFIINHIWLYKICSKFNYFNHLVHIEARKITNSL